MHSLSTMECKLVSGGFFRPSDLPHGIHSVRQVQGCPGVYIGKYTDPDTGNEITHSWNQNETDTTDADHEGDR
jgi:hypothetical protein